MKYPIVISYHNKHITASHSTSYHHTLSPRKKNLSSNSKRVKIYTTKNIKKHYHNQSPLDN